MDQTRSQRPGSTNAATILVSRAGLAAAIGRVRIYERTALAAEQLAGLILAELEGAGADLAEQAEPMRKAAAIGTEHGANAGRAALQNGGPQDAYDPPSVFADEPDYTLAALAADLGLAEDDPIIGAAADAYVVAAAAAFWLEVRGDGSDDHPPTCILTRADGGDPDDGTTHGHEGRRPPGAGPATRPKIRYLARFTPEAWIRGQAIEVDPAGPQEWDCTAFATEPDSLAYLAKVAAASHGDLSDPAGVLDNDDWFMGDPDAPDWVRCWSGPFTIRVRTEPMVTVYWQAEATRAADIWYSELADLARDGDLTVPPLSELMTKARVIPPGHPVWPGEALAEALDDRGYEVVRMGSLVVELAVHDAEPSGARPTAGTIRRGRRLTPPADSERAGHRRDASQAKGMKTVE
jgi:hypothetical protein